MLSMDNCNFFELPFSEGIQNTGMKDIIRINNEGYVITPTKPGLGFDLDEEKIADLTV